MGVKKDKSVWNKIKKGFTGLTAEQLSIGFFEESVYGPENDNLQVAQVAQFSEEGTALHPTRPFMRVGFIGALKSGKYKENFDASILRISEGRSTFVQEYTKLGPVLVKEMQQVIKDWDTPPNSLRTIEEKGFNDPLIKSSKMLNSVEFKVEKQGDQ